MGMTPRKMRKKLKHIKWDIVENNPIFDEYRNGGEWQGLTWLKAYSENKAGCEPIDFVLSGLRAMGRAKNPCRLVQMLETVLRYGKEN